jgi:hypothetical protein
MALYKVGSFYGVNVVQNHNGPKSFDENHRCQIRQYLAV